MAASSFHDVCAAGPLQTYDDGVFVGHIQRFTACNGTRPASCTLGNPADHAFTADLVIQLTGQPDDAATLTACRRRSTGSLPAALRRRVVDGVPVEHRSCWAVDDCRGRAGGSLGVLRAGDPGPGRRGRHSRADRLPRAAPLSSLRADIDAAAADLSAVPAALFVLLNCGISVLGLPSG